MFVLKRSEEMFEQNPFKLKMKMFTQEIFVLQKLHCCIEISQKSSVLFYQV